MVVLVFNIFCTGGEAVETWLFPPLPFSQVSPLSCLMTAYLLGIGFQLSLVACLKSLISLRPCMWCVHIHVTQELSDALSTGRGGISSSGTGSHG